MSSIEPLIPEKNDSEMNQVNKYQTFFLRKCKDIYKFIKRKIIKEYVCPEFEENPNIKLPLIWSYYDIKEKISLTLKQKCFNVFKNDEILQEIQCAYEKLENLIKKLDENRKNVELMIKNNFINEKKKKLLSDLNKQLNQYFNNNNANLDKSFKIMKDFNKINNLENKNDMNLLGKKRINAINNEEEKFINIDEELIKIKNKNKNKKSEINIINFEDIHNQNNYIKNEKEQNEKDEKNKNEKSKIFNISFAKIINLQSQSEHLQVDDNNNFLNNKQFAKILVTEFTNNNYNNLKIAKYKRQIKNLKSKISSIKLNSDKFKDPCIIGSHKIFDEKYLLNSIPTIDILLKCKEIQSMEEISKISEQIMTKKLKIDYIEICKAYEKSSDIIKVINKCKIKINNYNEINKDDEDNVFFVYINFFFVDIDNNNFILKENCVQNYYLTNKIYDNKNKILMCLFLRRWRRKFKLYFIKPEFLDIIMNAYYIKLNNKNIGNILKNMFCDLFNNKIIINIDNNIKKEKDDFDINFFIKEWYYDEGNKKDLLEALSISINYLAKNDISNLMKYDDY